MFQRCVINTKAKDNAMMTAWRKSASTLFLPTRQKFSAGFAPDAQIVIGDAIAPLGKILAKSTSPTKMSTVARTIDKRLANKTNPNVSHHDRNIEKRDKAGIAHPTPLLIR